MKEQQKFKPHRWCRQLHLYYKYGKPRQFPETLCMACFRARDVREAYLRGYKRGWKVGRKK